jgi:thiosulfate/3-mercaptopyruvate sulfurtransferase
MRPQYDLTLSPHELAPLIGRDDVVVIDCRHDLARPEWGRAAYREGHIPGALFAHLDDDLSGPLSTRSGRHPLPATQAFAATASRWGIDERVQVVAYDAREGALAARLWWLLKYLGHEAVAVLDGGLAAWQADGLPLASDVPQREPRVFRPQPDPPRVVATREIEAALQPGTLLLVDARSAERFAGRNETLDPVAGHVPGARNHPFASNLDANGHFLPAERLRERWQATLAAAPASQVVCMCGSGVTACHNLLALELAGLPGARLYAGSWSEWIRDPGRPVARG